MKNWKNSTAGVVGMGRTGYSVARYLSAQGARVIAYDRRPFEEFSAEEKAQWNALANVEPRTGHERDNVLDGVEHIILSPGVPANLPSVLRQKDRGVPVWSEIELASHYVQGPLLAVGGTNGKSTTTTLLGNLLKAAGWSTFVGGNLGTPLIDAIGSDDERFVVEVSSFQMEATDMFKPHVAILLNVSPDHMERYRSIEDYARTKARMFRRMRSDDVAILNADDALVMSVAPQGPQIWKWSFLKRPSTGAFSDAEGLHFSTPAAVFSVKHEDIALRGRHNEENVMAATLAALAVGVAPNQIREVLRYAKGLPHRVEFVRENHGVRFYDDSKGTNLGAVAAALEGFTAPVVLIAGGVDKGGDYKDLLPAIEKHVRSIIVLGEAADKISTAWSGVRPVIKAADMDEAVRIAAAEAKPGDAVLLSPACSSFDMFRDYKERGQRFQSAVHRLDD
jgi:UDP-N-acetylmuramoylalanine--D-glutamate ligase